MLEATNKRLQTALHCVVSGDHLYDTYYQLVVQLVGSGANINAQSDIMQTPLMIAASCGNLNIIDYLVRRGAELIPRTKE